MARKRRQSKRGKRGLSTEEPEVPAATKKKVDLSEVKKEVFSSGEEEDDDGFGARGRTRSAKRARVDQLDKLESFLDSASSVPNSPEPEPVVKEKTTAKKMPATSIPAPPTTVPPAAVRKSSRIQAQKAAAADNATPQPGPKRKIPKGKQPQDQSKSITTTTATGGGRGKGKAVAEEDVADAESGSGTGSESRGRGRPRRSTKGPRRASPPRVRLDLLQHEDIVEIDANSSMDSGDSLPLPLPPAKVRLRKLRTENLNIAKPVKVDLSRVKQEILDSDEEGDADLVIPVPSPVQSPSPPPQQQVEESPMAAMSEGIQEDENENATPRRSPQRKSDGKTPPIAASPPPAGQLVPYRPMISRVIGASPKNVGSPDRGRLVKTNLMNLGGMTPEDVIKLNRSLALVQAENHTLSEHIQMNSQDRNKLVEDNYRLRQQVTVLLVQKEKERERAEAAWRRLDQMELFSKAKEHGAEQRFFLKNKFELKVKQIKDGFDTRLKEVETDRIKLARENEVLSRKSGRHGKIVKRLKKKIRNLVKIMSILLKTLEMSYSEVEVEALLLEQLERENPELKELAMEYLSREKEKNENEENENVKVLGKAFWKALGGGISRRFLKEQEDACANAGVGVILSEEEEDEEEDEDFEEVGLGLGGQNIISSSELEEIERQVSGAEAEAEEDHANANDHAPVPVEVMSIFEPGVEVEEVEVETGATVPDQQQQQLRQQQLEKDVDLAEETESGEDEEEEEEDGGFEEDGQAEADLSEQLSTMEMAMSLGMGMSQSQGEDLVTPTEMTIEPLVCSRYSLTTDAQGQMLINEFFDSQKEGDNEQEQDQEQNEMELDSGLDRFQRIVGDIVSSQAQSDLFPNDQNQDVDFGLKDNEVNVFGLPGDLGQTMILPSASFQDANDAASDLQTPPHTVAYPEKASLSTADILAVALPRSLFSPTFEDDEEEEEDEDTGLTIGLQELQDSVESEAGANTEEMLSFHLELPEKGGDVIKIVCDSAAPPPALLTPIQNRSEANKNDSISASDWDSDSLEDSQPPIVELPKPKLTERRRNRRHRIAQKKVKKTEAAEFREREHSVKARLAQEIEIVPVKAAANCEKMKLEQHLEKKVEEMRKRKADSMSPEKNQKSSNRTVPVEKVASIAPVPEVKKTDDDQVEDPDPKKPAGKKMKPQYSMQDLFGDGEEEEDKGEGKKTDNPSVKRGKKPSMTLKDLFGEDDDEDQDKLNPKPKRDKKTAPASSTLSESDSDSDDCITSVSSSSESEDEGEKDKEEVTAPKSKSPEPKAKDRYKALIDDLNVSESSSDSDSENESESEANSNINFDLSAPASPEPEEPEQGRSQSSMSMTQFEEEVDEKLLSKVRNLIRLDVTQLMDDEKDLLLLQPFKSRTVKDVIPCIYSIIKDTSYQESTAGIVTEERVTRCPLIPRFLNLYQIMKMLKTYFPSVSNELLLYIERIIGDDRKRELERGELLENLGRFIGALSLDESLGEQCLKVIFAFAMYRGPHIYPFVFGVICSDSNVFGYILNGFDSLPVESRALIFSLVRSVRWGNSIWSGKVNSFLTKSLLIEVPEISFDAFFEKILGEFKALESQREIERYTRVICLLIVQRGWPWFKAEFVPKFSKWMEEWTGGKISDGVFSAYLNRVIGMACENMRRVDVPDDVTNVLEIVEVVNKISGALPPIVSSAAQSAIRRISNVPVRPKDVRPELWWYDKRGDSNGGGSGAGRGRGGGSKKKRKGARGGGGPRGGGNGNGNWVRGHRNSNSSVEGGNSNSSGRGGGSGPGRGGFVQRGRGRPRGNGGGQRGRGGGVWKQA